MMNSSLVILLLCSICVIQCLGMTESELEDFSNFLEITSRLDINLKSKGPEDDYDENEPVSDHAWEESGKFEGDLILNERQRRLLVADVAEGLSRNGLQDSTKRWPNNEVIYYIQREHFTSGQVQAIQAGIDDLAQASCVKFTPYRRGDRDAVVIQGSRRGCFSQVGYQGGYQVLNLSGRHPVGRGCFRHGTVVHELLHSLGFYHMQSSPDRDDYIDVLWKNIIKPARHNFRKYNSFAVSDFGVGYDYESVLHYSRKAFSSNGQDTLVPKQAGAQIGQRVGLSQKDIQKLNKMYCDSELDDPSNADDDSITKKPTVKNKSKNKPFDGHGIGYHQGKTVVIKLEPTTVELYRLPTLPKFQTFDYFSKPPQVLLPALTDTKVKETFYRPSTIQSANKVKHFKPLTSKSLIHKTVEEEEWFNHHRNGVNNAAPTSEEKTIVGIVDLKKREENPTDIIVRELNDFSEEIMSDISDVYTKKSKLTQPQPYPTYTDYVRNSPELQIKDKNLYSRLHSETEVVPLEYKQYFQKKYEHADVKNNLNLGTFLPHTHASLVEDNGRNTYPSESNYYDPYLNESNVTESILNHFLPNESKSDEDFTTLSKTIPSYRSGYSNHNYNSPHPNYYDKARLMFQAQYN